MASSIRASGSTSGSSFRSLAQRHEAEAAERHGVTFWSDAWRRLRRDRAAMIGLWVTAFLIAAALVGPWLVPYTYSQQDFDHIFEPPSRAHWFGTDELGRDVLSRVIYGARVSIPLALLLVTLAAVIGGVLGAIAGYFRGVADGTVMRVTDLVFAFPAIILAMVVTAVLGRGLRNAVLAIVIVAWPAYARVVRGLVLSIGDSEYVQSARLLGVSSRTTLFRDVLPNVAGPVLVLATLDLGTAILLLSGLSFLGLGAQPPEPEWGSMVATGTQYFQQWWIGTFPGLAIFTAVIAFNFLGDSLRDFFDPTSAADRGR
jgi:peptide/nickel transport system permease protein